MPYSEQEIRDLKRIAATLRGNMIQMIPPGKVGHLGGSSSIMDVTAALYFKHMRSLRIPKIHVVTAASFPRVMPY